MGKFRRVPVWMTVMIIAVVFPTAFMLPWLLSESGQNTPGLFMVFYPVYELASAWLAWLSYGRRTEMTWILLALMILTHPAMYMLVTAV